MTRWMAAVPLVVLLGLGGIGLVQLFDGSKPAFERVSRAAPEGAFMLLDGGERMTNFAALAEEGPIVVNLWASWCGPCRVEHPMLMALSERYGPSVHGVLFDDTPENGRAFLAELGDPFSTVALDQDGQLALDFGHTGVPETFVIQPGGEISLHIRGPLEPRHRAIIDAEMARRDVVSGRKDGVDESEREGG